MHRVESRGVDARVGAAFVAMSAEVPPRPTFSDDAGSEETFSRDDDVEDDARSGARERWREEFVGRERTRDDEDDDAFEDAREVPRRRREAEEEEDDLYAHFSRARVAVCEYAREDAVEIAREL